MRFEEDMSTPKRNCWIVCRSELKVWNVVFVLNVDSNESQYSRAVTVSTTRLGTISPKKTLRNRMNFTATSKNSVVCPPPIEGGWFKWNESKRLCSSDELFEMLIYKKTTKLHNY